MKHSRCRTKGDRRQGGGRCHSAKGRGRSEANEKINASLNENVLKYQQIEKWNGEYPNVVSSDSSILVDASSGRAASTQPAENAGE